jgi:6-phospho-beta-glucosidase
LYDGENLLPMLARQLEMMEAEPGYDERSVRMLRLAVAMDSLPASYFQYYFFKDELYRELSQKATTRAQDILANVPAFWDHYAEQADADHPHLDPALSRGGINELELAVDVIDAYVNDRREIWPVNVVNNGALPDFPADYVVEVPGMVTAGSIEPQFCGPMPAQTLPLVKALAEYQSLAADVAWHGTRREAIQALASHPLVMSLARATTIYDEMAIAHRDYLPERLLAN